VSAQDHLDLAHRRVEWSARALDAAADELHAAGEEGAVTVDTAELVGIESARTWGLVERIAVDRELAGTERRARDGL
jgi:hypothetical protein